MTSIVVKLTFVYRAVLPLIFKNVRRRKKVHNKCKSKKYSSQIQHPVTDLKMESFAKIVNGFKLKLFSQKSTILDVTQVLNLPLTTINKCFWQATKKHYHGVLQWWPLLPSRDFACSNSAIETLKTLEHDMKCV